MRNTRKPSKRYSMMEADEKVDEIMNESYEFSDIIYHLKPWIIQKLHIKDYEEIFRKICSPINEDDLNSFIDQIGKLGLKENYSNKDIDDFICILRPFFKFNPQHNYQIIYKADKIRESITDYKKLLSQKTDSGEDIDYLQILISNLENQLILLEKPKEIFAKDKQYQQTLDKIFMFYANLHESLRLPNPNDGKKISSTISQNIFLKFCKDFKLINPSTLSKANLISIFKRNALYYKVMHKDQFLYSLFEISKLFFQSSSKIELFYQYLAFHDAYFKCIHSKNLQKLALQSLEHSNSQTIINKTLPYRVNQNTSELKTRLFNNNNNISNKPCLKFPKTSCNKTRTPIT